MPKSLQRIMDIGEFLASPSLDPPDNLRVIITIPTERLAAVAIALGALKKIDVCTEDCTHLVKSSEEMPVTGYTGGKFEDGRGFRDPKGDIHFGQSVFVENKKSVHLLPDGFPKDRLPKKCKDEIEDLSKAFSCEQNIAGLQRSIMSAHPVLVVGYVDGFKDDVCMENSPLVSYHPLGRCGTGELKSGWFRHPTLLAGSLPSPDGDYSWLSRVKPRLVTTVGKAASLKRSCGLWPKVPVVLLLSRRASSSVAVVDEIVSEGWSPCWPDSEQAKNALSPGSGIEVGCWIEDHPPTSTYDQEDEEPEW